MTFLLTLVAIYFGITHGIPMLFAAIVEYSHWKDVQKGKSK